jgi:hypothetical protein
MSVTILWFGPEFQTIARAVGQTKFILPLLQTDRILLKGVGFKIYGRFGENCIQFAINQEHFIVLWLFIGEKLNDKICGKSLWCNKG